MSLTRLNEIVSYYFGKSHRHFGPRQEMEMETSPQSAFIKKIYTRDNALTFFGPDRPNTGFIGTIDNAGQACVKDFRFGNRYDSLHSEWHHTPDDFGTFHIHTIKGNHALMTAEEVGCLLTKIKDKCLGKKTDCALSQEDADKIFKRYTELHGADSENAQHLQYDLEKIVASTLSDYYRMGARSFSYAFTTTLIEKYIQPLLIDRGMKHTYASVFTSALNALNMAFLTSSWSTIALNLILRNVIKGALSYAGLDKKLNEALTEISAVLNFARNPLSLVEMGTTSIGAHLGQKAAFHVIHRLEKLRLEPSTDIANEDHAAAVATDIPSSLRRRR